MKTYYAWILALLYVMADSGPGWEDKISDYTDDFIFCMINPKLSEAARNDIYTRVFDLTVRR